MDKRIINLTIVGGCFIAQDNIAPEDLYHFHIKEVIEKQFNCSLNINLIRYDRFSDCMERIKSNTIIEQTDILLFHFRSEHLHRLVRFYYKYHNEVGAVRRSLNFLMLNHTKAEECDFLLQVGSPAIKAYKLPNSIHRFLRMANYLIGFIVGNAHYAFRNYEKLAIQVIEFCRLNEIEVILAGPVSRPHVIHENYLAQMLNRHMKEKFDNSENTYIDLVGIQLEEKSLFFENGTHVNELGHRRIAGLILQHLPKYIYN